MAIEGKDYIVKDGDVMHFRFNVQTLKQSKLRARYCLNTLIISKFS